MKQFASTAVLALMLGLLSLPAFADLDKTIQAVPGVPVIAATTWYFDNCTTSAGLGSYSIIVPPLYGTVTVADVSGPLPGCPSGSPSLPAVQAYYTWSAATPTGVSSVYFQLLYQSAGGSEYIDVTADLTSAPLSIVSALPAGRAGVLYPSTVVVSGGTPPYTISASGIPPGLAIGSNGEISGTPDSTDAGPYTITVSATDSAGAKAGPQAVSITISPEPPSLIVLANLSDNIYSGNAGYQNYNFIGNNCTFPPNTCENFTLAAGAYANQDDSEIVIAIRGTVFGLFGGGDSFLETLATVEADFSFGGTHPNGVISREVHEAAEFVQAVQAKYPNAQITLTGHSLGGGVAQLLGQASGLSTSVFDAPGAEPIYAGLRNQGDLTGFPVVNNSTYANVNYRLYGEQISLIGQPVGSTITLEDPPNTVFTTDASCVALREEIPTFAYLHKIDVMVTQIADNARQVSPIGEPELVSQLRTCVRP